MSARSITVGPGPLSRMPTTPVFSNAGGDCVARGAQALGCLTGGAMFLHREFGIAMEVLVEGGEVGAHLR